MTNRLGPLDDDTDLIGTFRPEGPDVLIENFRPPKPEDIDPPIEIPIPPSPPPKR